MQAAFANSFNDLSLLEGNKFKLLLRVPIDQVEISIDNETQIDPQLFVQLQQQSKAQSQQNLTNLYDKELIQAKRREIESDLNILQHIAALSTELRLEETGKLYDHINELLEYLSQKLYAIDQGESQAIEAATCQQDSQQADITTMSQCLSNSASASCVLQQHQQQQPAQQRQQQSQSQPQQASSSPLGLSMAKSALVQPPSLSNIISLNSSQQDSNTNLKLIIYNSSDTGNSDTVANSNLATRDLTGLSLASCNDPNSSLIVDQNQQSVQRASDNSLTNQQQSMDYDTLEVSFANAERRQAFVQAFIEAKQARFALFQQRQQQLRKVALRLTQNDQMLDPRNRKTRLSPQDLAADVQLARTSSPVFIDDVMSAQTNCPMKKLNHSPHIIHQTSAPHSLSSELDLTSYHQDLVHRNLSSNNFSLHGGSNDNNKQHQVSSHRHHFVHHHHHQLIHQPASHPGPTFGTICCNEQHNDANDLTSLTHMSSQQRHLNRVNEFQTSQIEINDNDYQQSRYLDLNQHPQQQRINIAVTGQEHSSENNRIGSLTFDIDHLSLANSTIPKYSNERIFSRMSQSLLFKLAPKFITTMPLNFLNTHHPALQFSCPAPRNYHNQSYLQIAASITSDTKEAYKDGEAKFESDNQNRDYQNQLWLCLSNGYVSHVALISLKRESTTKSANPKHDPECFRVTPIMRSAGDICKSQINCAAQVRTASIRRRNHVRCKKNSQASDNSSAAKEDLLSVRRSLDDATTASGLKRPTVEVQVKNASPPVDIKGRSSSSDDSKVRLSESAPSRSFDKSDTCRGDVIGGSSLSTGQLEIPPELEATSKSYNSKTNLTNTSETDKRRTLHGAVCYRQHLNNAINRQLQNRLGLPIAFGLNSKLSWPAKAQNQLTPTKHQHLRPNNPAHHYQQPHQHQQQLLSRHLPIGCQGLNSHHHHHHGTHHSYHHHHHHLHHAHQHHSHLHHHHHQQPHVSGQPSAHQPYTTRHNTVPIAQLRRALERQNCLPEMNSCNQATSCKAIQNQSANQSAQPHVEQKLAVSNSNNSLSCSSARSNQASGSAESLIKRSATPQAQSENRAMRSARLLRHQASLKTNSILARLVGGASKRTSYLVRKPSTKKQKSDQEDRELDNDSNKNSASGKQLDDNSSIDSNILSFVAPSKQHLNASISDVNNIMVSPLSSVSSLNTTSSSITINSMCASATNRSNCDLLVHSYSTSCCFGSYDSPSLMMPCAGTNTPVDQIEYGLRSRSATVPSRAAFTEQGAQIDGGSQDATCQGANFVNSQEQIYGAGPSEPFRVSEIVGDEDDRDDKSQFEDWSKDESSTDSSSSSLWLGCEGGSLIVINCLPEYNWPNADCNFCDLDQRNLACNNYHTEVKLGASICDICVYKDKLVFVGLSNGQLAIFSRQRSDGELIESMNVCSNNPSESDDNDGWCLTKPRLVNITNNELNTTSKLCFIEDSYIWYAYGRNIFVLNAETLSLEANIKPPINDMNLKISMQSIIIDNMEPMGDMKGVWVSFKNCHLIHLYDIKRHILLLEVNLANQVDRILSFGSEIIRQHKNACLKTTSLLNYRDTREACDTLFIGTSAGIIVYLKITREQLDSRLQKLDGSAPAGGDWKPHVLSLSHGHSGHVKFLNIIKLTGSSNRIEFEQGGNTKPVDLNNNNNNSDEQGNNNDMLFLVSGGIGVDSYGPSDEYHTLRNCGNDDNLNHLIIWKL